MEEEKVSYEELADLMNQIRTAMDITMEKEETLNRMEEDLYNETRPMMVEKKKGEFEFAKQQKDEFDEMTKNAMLKAKQNILRLKQESEQKYQEELVETVKKQASIKEKLISIKTKNILEEEKDNNISEEKRAMIENSAKEALAKIDNKMDEVKREHFEQIETITAYESEISDYAKKLNIDELIITEAGSKMELKEPEWKNSPNARFVDVNGERVENSEPETDKEQMDEIPETTKTAIPTEPTKKPVDKTTKTAIPTDKTSTESSMKLGDVTEIVITTKQDRALYKKDGKMIMSEKTFQECFDGKKDILKASGIREIIKEGNFNLIEKLRIYRRLNPVILDVIKDSPKQVVDYAFALAEGKKLPFKYIAALEGDKVDSKTARKLNRIAVREEQIEGTDIRGAIKHPIIDKLLSRFNKNKTLPAGEGLRRALDRIDETANDLQEAEVFKYKYRVDPEKMQDGELKEETLDDGKTASERSEKPWKRPGDLNNDKKSEHSEGPWKRPGDLTTDKEDESR